MLAGQEEVVVLVQKRSVQGYEGLPLLVVELCRGVVLGILRIINLNAFTLNHDKAGIYAFDLDNQLFRRYRASLWLFDHD